MQRFVRLTSLAVFVAWAAPMVGGGVALGQIGIGPDPNRFDLAETIDVPRAGAAVLAQLERVKAYVAGEQWADAVETLRQLLADSGEKMLPVDPDVQPPAMPRYVGMRDFIHLQLAALPPEALGLYRSRVDPVAQRWYEQGIAGRDPDLLTRVVDEAFASRFGDDALLALGDMALESGDYTTARWHFLRIVPSRPPPKSPPNAPHTWPGYPDTDLDLAAVRARLVLVSILEGSSARARDELDRFAQIHGDARGQMGRSDVNFVEALGRLLAASADWPPLPSDTDWPTFAGNPQRNRAAEQMIDVSDVAWRVPLRDVEPNVDAALSFHPVLVGDLVLVNNRREILGFELATGKPAWGREAPTFYRPGLDLPADYFAEPAATLGVPRFTMTAFDGKLYARMGTTVTSRPPDQTFDLRRGTVVCLDLKAQGALHWEPLVPPQGWAYEGSPVSDGANVYVAMRRSDVRPEAHVVCLDAKTGRQRWRTFVCGAELPAWKSYHRTTHGLLSLQGDTLYLNTNLGAVAAVSTRTGRVKWITLYDRARKGELSNLAPHWRRDLNPCLIDRGTLLVAPSDTPRIMAIDAATGMILWRSSEHLADVEHLLGTTGEHLIAAGRRVYWIGLSGKNEGRVTHAWPDGPERLGYGRGVLADGRVFWPTREKIYIFDSQTAALKRSIDLVPRGVTGGNLLLARGHLLIATGTELIALNRYGRGPRKPDEEIVAVPPDRP